MKTSESMKVWGMSDAWKSIYSLPTMNVHGHRVFYKQSTSGGEHIGYIKNAEVFKIDDKDVHNFFYHLVEKFGETANIRVAGSYVLWCLLGRPNTWKPGDIDVFFVDDHDLHAKVLDWLIKYKKYEPRIGLVSDGKTKLDFRFFRDESHEKMQISLVFKNVRDIMVGSDLSILRMHIPVQALFGNDAQFNFFDLKDMDDLQAMRARTHPLLAACVEGKYCYDWPPTKIVEMKPHKYKITTNTLWFWARFRMNKYLARGIMIVGDPDEEANIHFLTSCAWYDEDVFQDDGNDQKPTV